MYSVTWIASGELYSVTSPNMRTAVRLLWSLKCKGGLCARMWAHKKAGKLELLLG